MCKSHARRIVRAPARHSHSCPSFSKLVVIGLTASSFLFNQVVPGVDARLTKRHGPGGDDSLRPGFMFPPCVEEEVSESQVAVRAFGEGIDGHFDHSHQQVRRGVKSWNSDGNVKNFVSRAVSDTEDGHVHEAGDGHDHAAEVATVAAVEDDHSDHDHSDHDNSDHSTEQCGTVNQAALDAYCDAASDEPYDLGLHIGAIFIQIGVSLLGTMVPLLGRWVPALKMSDYVFSWFKNFGSGVILATGCTYEYLKEQKI
jgi:hypothetical protein